MTTPSNKHRVLSDEDVAALRAALGDRADEILAWIGGEVAPEPVPPSERDREAARHMSDKALRHRCHPNRNEDSCAECFGQSEIETLISSALSAAREEGVAAERERCVEKVASVLWMRWVREQDPDWALNVTEEVWQFVKEPLRARFLHEAIGRRDA